MINPHNHKDLLPSTTNIMATITAEADREESEAKDIKRVKVPEKTRDDYAIVVQRLGGWSRADSNSNEKGEET